MQASHQHSSLRLTIRSGLIIFISVMIIVLFIWNSAQMKSALVLQQHLHESRGVAEEIAGIIHAFEFRSVLPANLPQGDQSPGFLRTRYFGISEQSYETGTDSAPLEIIESGRLASGTRIHGGGEGSLILHGGRNEEGIESAPALQWNCELKADSKRRLDSIDIVVRLDSAIIPLWQPLDIEVPSSQQAISGNTGFLQLATGDVAFGRFEIEPGLELIVLRPVNRFALVPWIPILIGCTAFLVLLVIVLRYRRFLRLLHENHPLSQPLFRTRSDDEDQAWSGPWEKQFVERRRAIIQRQMVEAMNAINAGVVVSRDTKILYINGPAAEMFGDSAERLAELGVDGILGRLTSVPGNNPSIEELASWDGHSENSVPNWYGIENGHPENKTWVQASISKVDMTGFELNILTMIDQSAVYEYEQRVESQNRFLGSILEAISDPFYVIETENRKVVMANTAAREIMQGKRETTCQALNPGTSICSNRNQLCPYELSKLTKVSSLVERFQLDEDGSHRYFEIHGHPVINENDEVTHVIEYQLDVTSRKRADKSLRESEERYSSLFEKNNSVMLLYDPETGGIVDANPAACEFYGYTREEFTEKHIVDINTMSPFELYQEMQKAKQEGRHQLYFQHRLANGEIRDVEAYTGLLKVSDKDLYYSIIYDITQRRRAQRELQKLIDLETLAASLSTRFIRLQAQEIDQQIQESLREIGHFSGYQRCLLFTVKNDFSGVISCHEWHASGMNSLADTIKSFSINSLSWLQSRHSSSPSIATYDIRNSGSFKIREMQFWKELGIDLCHYIPFQVSFGEIGVMIFEDSLENPVESENTEAFMRIVAELFSNALEKKQYEQRLLENQNVLKSLSSHIQDEIEAVRSSIAREVHDELGQLLTALKFDVRWVEKRVDSGREVIDKLVEMGEVIDNAVASVQRITAELRPILLDDLGLGPAIEWHAREFSRRTGIEMVVEAEDVNAGKQESTTLFRVCQEALTNIARHSQADAATIDLSAEPGGLRMEVSDNGVGISKEQIQSNKSFGIIGVQERVQALGGAVSISGTRGKGTKIEVWIPQAEKGDKSDTHPGSR